MSSMRDFREKPPTPAGISEEALSVAFVAGMEARALNLPPRCPPQFATMAVEWHRGWVEGKGRTTRSPWPEISYQMSER